MPRSTLIELWIWLTCSTSQAGPTWMTIFASKSFLWCWTTSSSHPTHIVTLDLLTHFGVMTWRQLLDIIVAKSSMIIHEKQAAKWKMARQLRMEKPAILQCSLFLMVQPIIHILHFDRIFYNTQNDLISLCQMANFLPQPPDASRCAWCSRNPSLCILDIRSNQDIHTCRRDEARHWSYSIWKVWGKSICRTTHLLFLQLYISK
jgi:hypothetical protein